jgi:hypothetical protein
MSHGGDTGNALDRANQDRKAIIGHRSCTFGYGDNEIGNKGFVSAAPLHGARGWSAII